MKTETKPGLRPFFPFYGSKWNLARYYPPPRFTHVVEPFAGSAGYSVFHGCRVVSLYDADPIIRGVWDYLINVSAEEVRGLPEIPEPGDSVDNYKIPEEAKWLIGFWLNRGSSSPKKCRTAYSARSDKSQLNWGPRAKDRIAGQLEFIREWRVRGDSFENAPQDVSTWFVDPPYAVKGVYYRFRIDDYGKLSEWCRDRPGQLIVCEGQDADWLPFQPLGEFKTSKGFSQERVYLRDEGRVSV